MDAMVIYYFGADIPWTIETESDLSRRNMAVLWTLAEHPGVEMVYNVIRCTRAMVLFKRRQTISKHSKIKNLYIGPILPQRGVLKYLCKPLNRLLIRRLSPKDSFKNQNRALSWCYWPKGFRDFKFLDLKTPMIFDTDHNIIDNPNIKTEDKIEREKLLITAGKAAKLILSSSRSMIAWYNQRGVDHTRLLLNGLFPSRINLIKRSRTGAYKVTYCGTLSKWLKTEWLLQMAQDYPEWDIHIIGENYKTELSKRFEKFDNVILHGFLPPSKFDEIITQSDVCIGLYREMPSLDVNSMKLYDYLAKGKPVVVNAYHPHLQSDFKGLLHLTSTYKDFIKAVAQPKSVDKNDLDKFFEESTWYRRVDPILNELEEALYDN
jgi:hypothetical protein